MNVPLIPVEVERAIAAARVARVPDPESGWRTKKPLPRAVFFFLTCIGIGAFFVFAEGLVTAVAAIAFAELLIVRRRWFFTGVEEALWLGGVLSALTLLPRQGTPESFLVIAAAIALAAARVRNPLFAPLAAMLVAIWSEERLDAGAIVALLLAAAAGLSLLRTWRRPSTEWMFISAVLILPIAGRFMADAQWRWMTIALYAVFGSGMLALAIVRRHHALFLAAMIGLTLAVADAGRLAPVVLEVKLAVAGAALLALAFAASRALRGRTSGFVATPASLTSFDEELQSAATIALAPETPREEQPAPVGEGGSFGGAGASGDY